ncbi:unnamed protein product [Nippostrongylus brasiliensis]|uniref:Prothymosin alpha-like n=1 Tax=Nippostrongylus brasiliensis TaxID=27835 RepID=A0A0N4XRR4_NIPBR|nr:unnamed protein product [Nippostrongylus brasiliensis]
MKSKVEPEEEVAEEEREGDGGAGGGSECGREIRPGRQRDSNGGLGEERGGGSSGRWEGDDTVEKAGKEELRQEKEAEEVNKKDGHKKDELDDKEASMEG